MARPIGVTLLAIASSLGAAWGAYAGVRLMASGLVALRSENFQGSAVAASMISNVVTFPALYAIAGWGLWRLRHWGRLLAIGLLVYSSAYELLRMFVTSHLKGSDYLGTTVLLAITGAISWYLLKRVNAAFSPG